MISTRTIVAYCRDLNSRLDAGEDPSADDLALYAFLLERIGPDAGNKAAELEALKASLAEIVQRMNRQMAAGQPTSVFDVNAALDLNRQVEAAMLVARVTADLTVA